MLWTRQEREGMIICDQILKYRGLLLLCVARWFFYYKISLQKRQKRKDPEAIMGGKGFLEKPLSFTAIKQYALTTFCLKSGWQKLHIPSYLSFLYTHECNGRCYFWRRRGHSLAVAVEDSFQSFVHPLLVRALHNNDEAVVKLQQPHNNKHGEWDFSHGK